MLVLYQSTVCSPTNVILHINVGLLVMQSINQPVITVVALVEPCHIQIVTVVLDHFKQKTCITKRGFGVLKPHVPGSKGVSKKMFSQWCYGKYNIQGFSFSLCLFHVNQTCIHCLSKVTRNVKISCMQVQTALYHAAVGYIEARAGKPG